MEKCQLTPLWKNSSQNFKTVLENYEFEYRKNGNNNRMFQNFRHTVKFLLVVQNQGLSLGRPFCRPKVVN